MSTKIITLVLLAVGVLIAAIALFIIQRNDRKFGRKGIIFYLLITIVFLFVFGLIGIFYTQNAGVGFWLTQLSMFAFGVFHVWLLFSYYEWAERTSFLPETVLTLAATLAVALGFHAGLWVWGLEKVFDFELGLHGKMVRAVLWLPIPYLFLRLYDFILQIPQKRFVAWKFPETDARKLNLSDDNVVFVYLNMFTRSEDYQAGKITDHRARMPKNAAFGDFFQNFVSDYNEDNTYPITNLNKNEQHQTIGWLFYGRKTKRGRQFIIDPYKSAFSQIKEGDFVEARRVTMGEEYKSTEPDINIATTPSISDDDEIIITER